MNLEPLGQYYALRAALEAFAQYRGPDGLCFDLGGCLPSDEKPGTRKHQGRCLMARAALEGR